ncbi:MAG: ATP-binding protein [Prevotellaceae bacterium]|jgi:predicted AAA+ superfamily ATPase|nr:ATP-binding protein [Prevotellaceae bacterium]
MSVIRTILPTIKSRFFKGKVIILVGPRQVGKTTLLRQLVANGQQETALSLNCDEPDVLHLLENATSTELKTIIGSKRIVLIDEAQRVGNIGITLKLIVDNIPDIQLIVTGSSAFEINNKINEPLTGRKFEYHLYPFSTEELIEHTSLQEENRLLERRMIYGMYPDVVNNPSDANDLLIQLTNSYLFKDILIYKDIRRSDDLNKLLTAVALQVGSEVSYNELSRIIGMDKETVERYLDLLEKVFVIFRLPAFSRNLRQELKKSRKIYFYDNGIRNALINNFQPLALRNDVGALWENYLISERKKHNEYKQFYAKTYFWRTHTMQEIDYIEEHDGKLFAYEFKWNEKRKAKFPALFSNTYPENEFNVINRLNYLEFVK